MPVHFRFEVPNPAAASSNIPRSSAGRRERRFRLLASAADASNSENNIPTSSTEQELEDSSEYVFVEVSTYQNEVSDENEPNQPLDDSSLHLSHHRHNLHNHPSPQSSPSLSSTSSLQHQPDSPNVNLGQCKYCTHEYHHNFQPCKSKTKSPFDFCVNCECNQSVNDNLPEATASRPSSTNYGSATSSSSTSGANNVFRSSMVMGKHRHCKKGCNQVFLFKKKVYSIIDWLNFIDAKYKYGFEQLYGKALSTATFDDFSYLMLFGIPSKNNTVFLCQPMSNTRVGSYNSTSQLSELQLQQQAVLNDGELEYKYDEETNDSLFVSGRFEPQLTFDHFDYFNEEQTNLSLILDRFVNFAHPTHRKIIYEEILKLYLQALKREHLALHQVVQSEQELSFHIKKYIQLLEKKFDTLEVTPDVTERSLGQELTLTEIRKCSCTECSCKECPTLINCPCVQCSCDTCDKQVKKWKGCTAVNLVTGCLFTSVTITLIVLFLLSIFYWQTTVYVHLSLLVAMVSMMVIAFGSCGIMIYYGLKLTQYYETYDPELQKLKSDSSSSLLRDSAVGLSFVA